VGRRGDGPQAVIASIVACRTELRIPIAVACRALDVSESWFYKHRDRPPTASAVRRAELDTAIVEVFASEDGEYGSPRVHAELVERAQFAKLSVNTVAKRMRDKGLRAKVKPVRRSLTRPDVAAPKFENLLNRQFNPAGPNMAWCGDITEIVTWEGKLYLATVIDLWSRRLIGFAIAEHCKATLVCDALRMAIAQRGGNVAGVMMHTDRGSQGELNRSSQHFTMMEVRGSATTAVGRQGASTGNAVTGATDAGASCGARVLASDRSRQEHRGRRCRDRGVGPRRVSLVPARWRHATCQPRRTNRPVLVVL
jgi:putative transposase